MPDTGTRPGAQAPRFQARAAGSVGGGVDETSRHVAALGPAFKANCDEGAVELRLRNDADIDPYIVATNADIPEFDAYFAGGFDEETSPLGAKGLGELTAAASAAPAIANAVCHATGKRIRDLPVTAERLP